MIYTLKIQYTMNSMMEEGTPIEELTLELDSEIFNITYSNMMQRIEAFAETNRLSFGTLNGEILLSNFWNTLKLIEPQCITSVAFYLGDILVKDFEGTVNNVIYNINFNGPGDMIIFDYAEEE